MRHLAGLLLITLAAVAQPPAELIPNGRFDQNVAGWAFWFSPGQSAGQAAWVERDDGGALGVEVERRDQQSAIQIYYGPFKITRGVTYRVQFEARADRPFSLPLRLMKNNPPYSTYGLNTTVPLTTDWQTYVLLATATDDSDDARLDFFPEASCQFDNVSIQATTDKLSGQAPTAVTLGAGWQGQPEVVRDGDPKTEIHSGYYPRLPLFITADLGTSRAVQAVLIGSRDSGQWVYLTKLSVQLSEDGRTWGQWAEASRPRRIGETGPLTFTASSLAVKARYLRVRIDAMKGTAIVSEVAVVSSDGPGVSARVLPVIPPVEDLCFRGWDYDRLGYDLSPGEQPALWWSAQGDRAVETKVHWDLQTYNGSTVVASGDATLSCAPGQVGQVPFRLPTKPADGPYRVVASFPDEPTVQPEPFQFDYRAPTAAPGLGLNLVALMDSQDSEGWVRILSGALADQVAVYAAAPAGLPIDAALVCAEAWQADEPRVTWLRNYLNDGGQAIVYGKPAPGFAAFLPIEVTGDGYRDTPLALTGLDPAGPWAGFEPTTGPRHYAVRCTAKSGARVLAKWSDGSPAVVDQTVGRGRLVYVGCASGQTWQPRPELDGADELTFRLLYDLVGRRQAWPAALKLAAQRSQAAAAARAKDFASILQGTGLEPPALYHLSADDNVGRFGWQFNEGLLVENLNQHGELSCSAASSLKWSVQLPDAVEPKLLETDWAHKVYAWYDGDGEAVRATIGLASPAVMFETSSQQVKLPASEVTHVLVPTAVGPQAVEVTDGAVLPQPSEGWLLLLSAGEQQRDVPRLVVLSRRPTKLSWDGGLKLTFGQTGAGAFWLLRPYGQRRFAPGETKGWLASSSKAVLTQLRRVARLCLAYPIGCDEAAWVEGDQVTVVDRFRYRETKSEFGTAPLRVATLPPVLSLARRYGVYPAGDAKLEDLGIATKYGPLEAVVGDRVVYHLTLPPRDHFGVVPAAEKRELQEQIDYYGLQGALSVKRASGGISASSDFLEDLRRYMSSSSYENPFEAPCIDLYKWWYCFPAVSARPAATPEARRQLDEHYLKAYRTTVNYYPYKCHVRERRDPFTGIDYTVSFIWPVFVRNGVRYFVDQNESAAVIDYCFDMYARYYGDWTTIAANWNLVKHLGDYLPKFHDWAWMASSNLENFGVAGIDMLNSEYPGGLAFAHLAQEVGEPQAATTATVLAAKSLVPAVARLAMPRYVQDITADGDPWRRWKYYYSFHEAEIRGADGIDMRGGPESILELAIGLLDTSKGTGPELPLAYQVFAHDAMNQYEQELLAEEHERQHPAGWMHLMQRAILGWPRSDLVAGAKRFREFKPNFGWQSAKAPHCLALVEACDSELFLADWTPAAYVKGESDEQLGMVVMWFQLTEPGPAKVRLYSRRQVTVVAVDGRGPGDSRYDPQTGWLTVSFGGVGEHTVALKLGEPVAPLHAYFAGTG